MPHPSFLIANGKEPPKPHEMLELSAEEQRMWLRYFTYTDPDYAQLQRVGAGPTTVILYLLARKMADTDLWHRRHDTISMGCKMPADFAQQFQQRPVDPDDVPLGECCICKQPEPCSHTRLPTRERGTK